MGRLEISSPAIGYFTLKLAAGQHLLARGGDLPGDPAQFPAEF